MSPLRRLWLAWGGWELAVVLACLVLLQLLAGFEIWIVGGEFRAVGERPFFGVLVVTLPLGLRMRNLLMVDCLAMARAHTTWVMRWFCLAILPAVALVIATSLVLTGVPPLWSVAIAASLAALGAWMGFTLSPRPAYAAGLGLVGLLSLVTERDGVVGDALSVAALVAVSLAVRLAWRRLEARTVCPPAIWRWESLERLLTRFDALMMPQLSPSVASGRLPTLLTALRVELCGLGGSWRLHLIGLLLMAVGACLVSSQAVDLRDRLPLVLFITTLIACVVSLAWFTVGGAQERHARGQVRRLMRGLLASQRLLPLPRRQAAAAIMLSFIGNCLSRVLPLTGGMLLGLVLADAWQGRDSSGLWLVLPQAVAITACSAAGMLLLLIQPPTVAIIGVVVAGNILIWTPIVLQYSGAAAYPTALLIAAGLALVLVPLAWWRLAESEMP